MTKGESKARMTAARRSILLHDIVFHVMRKDGIEAVILCVESVALNHIEDGWYTIARYRNGIEI